MGIYDKLSKNKHLKKIVSDYSEKTLALKDDFINTGVATLNILYSGKIDGGIPKHKISMIAGESGIGKSLQSIMLLKNALKRDMNVIYIDTEFALNEAVVNNFGLDYFIENKSLIIVSNNDIVEIKQIIGNLKDELSFDEKENTLLIIDSWDGMVTSKTVDDAVTGKDVVDMQTTRQKNSLANLLLTLHPMTIFVVNRVYEAIGSFVPQKVISGGSKIFYNSSSVVKTTSQAKYKEGDDIEGKIVTAIVEKGRYVRQHTKLKYMIKFNGAIHPYYGILDDALEGGYVTKPSNGWYTRPHISDDRKWREKEIWDNAKEFWQPILRETDFKQYIEKKYKYSNENVIEIDEENF